MSTSLRKAMYGGDPRLAALACRAAGIDRCVFGTVYNLSRHDRQLTTELSGTADRHEVELVFTEVSRRPSALDTLKAALSA